MRGALAVWAVGLVIGGCGGAPEEGFRVERRGVTRWAINEAVDEPPPLPLTFHLEQTFGVDRRPAEAILGSVAGIAVDDGGRLFVLDRASSRIIAFERDGAVLWATGREGQGPGELQRPAGMDLDGLGALWLANQGGTRLDEFGVDGTFRRSLALPVNEIGGFDLVGFLSHELFVGRSPVPGAVGVDVSILRLDGSRIERLDELRFHPHPGLAVPRAVFSGVDAITQRGRIYLGHDDELELRELDVRLQLVRVTLLRTDHLVRTGIAWLDDERGAIASMGEVRAPLVLEGGQWLVHAYWPTDVDDPDRWTEEMMSGRGSGREDRRREWASGLYLFDPEGRFVGAEVAPGSTRPRIGRLRLVGPDGRLYTSLRDPFPQVRRYRVEMRGSTDEL